MDLQFKLAIASRKDWPILNQIMQKGLSLISEKERAVIFNKWIHIQGTKQISRELWLGLIITTASILLIIIATLVWNRTLRRQVAQRTMELKGELMERKRTEEALRESEERFRVIATYTPDHILIQDKDLRYVWVLNPQLGLTEEDMIGKTDFDFLSKEDAVVLTAMKRRVLETGKPEFVRVPLTSFKRDVQYFEGSYIAKCDQEGKNDGLIGYFRNVTERVEGEEQRKKLEAQLLQSQKMESVGTLAGGIAHDYNNLLAVIMGNLSMAQEETDPHSITAELLHEAEQASLKARDLTHQFLVLSHGGHPVKTLGSVESLLKEIPEQVQAHDGIEYAFSIQNDLWSVEYDPSQIEHAIRNLLMNAVEAMPQGVCITIQAENQAIDNKDKESHCFSTKESM